MIPTDVAGLRLWLKADALVLSDNDPVGTWADSSGQANDATEATNKPTYKTGILNSLPVVRFNGTDNRLTCGASDTYKHVFAVAKYAASSFAVYAGLITGVNGVEEDLVLLGDSGLGTFYNVSFTTVYHKDGTLFAENNMQGPMNTFAILSISWTTGWVITLRLGQDRSIASRFWNGDIAEVIAYNSVLSDSDRDGITAYLTAKWFTAASSPSPSFRINKLRPGFFKPGLAR